jgi:hypothetical protein
MRLDRIEKQEVVIIDVINCMTQPELNGTSLTGSTLDVSESGMKVAAAMAIPVSTRLGLRLDLGSRLYRLEGVVRWSKNEGQHCIGLLLDDDSADIVAWQRMFELDL